jgi:hypothetical protein
VVAVAVVAEAEVEEGLVVEVSRPGVDIVVVTEVVDGDLLHTRADVKMRTLESVR